MADNIRLQIVPWHTLCEEEVALGTTDRVALGWTVGMPAGSEADGMPGFAGAVPVTVGGSLHVT